jgi:hypothetical protein
MCMKKAGLKTGLFLFETQEILKLFFVTLEKQ